MGIYEQVLCGLCKLCKLLKEEALYTTHSHLELYILPPFPSPLAVLDWYQKRRCCWSRTIGVPCVVRTRAGRRDEAGRQGAPTPTTAIPESCDENAG